MIFRFNQYYPIIGIGLSYTPLQTIDWKNNFRIAITQLGQIKYFRIKILLLDFMIIWKEVQQSSIKVGKN